MKSPKAIINPIKNTIETSVYHKSIGRSELIPAHSNHPEHMLFNIIYNETLRATRLSSNSDDFKKEKIMTLKRALYKGYDLKKIKKAMKPKTKIVNNTPHNFIMLTYDQGNLILKQKMKNSEFLNHNNDNFI